MRRDKQCFILHHLLAGPSRLRASVTMHRSKGRRSNGSSGEKKRRREWSIEIRDVEQLHKELLPWYKEHHRRLPWRAEPFDAARNRSENSPGAPYPVWVSEIMLQQTRVATVIDYYNRWMSVFSSVEALANADLERVNELWAGLGYYRRAKMLHEGAKYVVNELGGSLPSTVDALRKIPGIGPYTAGAISSIAFDRPEPLVDGNVARVLSRLWCIDEEPSSSSYWSVAEICLNRDHPGDFNQALMELGATVCTARTPLCSSCPLNTLCRAYRRVAESTGDMEDMITTYPKKAAKTKQRAEAVAVVIIEADGKLLLTKRPDTGLLAGLWEFPNVVVDDVHDAREEEKRLKQAVKNLGMIAGKKVPKYIGEVQHIFSHIRQTLRVYVLRKCKLHDTSKKYSWFTEDDVENIAISKQMKKVLSKAKTGLTQDTEAISKFFKKVDTM
mmetsp:Transcript_8147/g.24533  ORF Transcript_8147/g.24533 Transcript_8147/m.24533 type:complete len:443 (+) Transcript_8147:85-1413(+)